MADTIIDYGISFVLHTSHEEFLTVLSLSLPVVKVGLEALHYLRDI